MSADPPRARSVRQSAIHKTFSVYNKKLGLKIERSLYVREKYCGSNVYRFYCSLGDVKATVLGSRDASGNLALDGKGDTVLGLTKKEGLYIVETYALLRKKRLDAEKQAAESKAAMEENEKKWNLAESLLGMKRLPSGALVPADPAKHEEEDEGALTCDGLCDCHQTDFGCCSSCRVGEPGGE